MKKLLLICIAFASCQQHNSNLGSSEIDTAIKSKEIDSLSKVTVTDIVLQDTLTLTNAPVKIISAKPVKNGYSNYRAIQLTFKNVSDKDISGIKFKWFGVNAFNEPAQMGSVAPGISAGFTDNLLRSGKTSTATFDISSKDLKKVVKAWVYEVAFEDGSKWKLAK